MHDKTLKTLCESTTLMNGSFQRDFSLKIEEEEKRTYFRIETFNFIRTQVSVRPCTVQTWSGFRGYSSVFTNIGER